MPRIVRLAVLLAFAVACLAASASAAPRAVRDCFGPEEVTVRVSSVRNMSCARARKVMRRHRSSISKHFTTTHYGFHCRRVSGMALAGQWRCTKGAKAFRFEFAD